MAAWSVGFLQTHVRGGTIVSELRHSQPVGILHISVEKLSRIGGRTCDSSGLRHGNIHSQHDYMSKASLSNRT